MYVRVLAGILLYNYIDIYSTDTALIAGNYRS